MTYLLVIRRIGAALACLQALLVAVSVTMPPAPSALAAGGPGAGPPVFRSATLEAYQSVANPIRGTEYAVLESDDYAVTLIQDQSRVKSFTHKSISPNTQPREAVARRASWTQFSFDGTVDVEVRSLHGNIRSLQVLPSRLAIPVENVASDRRLVHLTRPEKLALVINGDDLNPLFVYASAMPTEPEPDPTDAGVVSVGPGRHDPATVKAHSDARVLVFQPGVHQLDARLTVRPGQHVHLSAGSFVLGQIVGRAPTFAGLRIDGRGVLSGQHHGALNWQEGTLIFLNGGAAFQGRIPYQVEISGITLANQPSFAIRLYSVPYVHISGINIGPGWYFRTDGIESGPHALIEDVFLNCNDDSVKLIFGDSEWRRLTIWQGTNGASVQFSWNTDHETTNVSVHDVDIVHVSTKHDAPNHAVFGSMHAGSGYVHGIRIENVTIEGPVFRLFRIGTFYTHDAIREDGQAGGIGDITFRNVTVEQTPSVPSDFLLCQDAGRSGKCPHTFLEPIIFENLGIAGQQVQSLEELNAKVEPANRAKIVFR